MPQDLFHNPHLPICLLDLLVHPLGDLHDCCHVADGDTITVLDAESRTTPQRADSPKQSSERQS